MISLDKEKMTLNSLKESKCKVKMKKNKTINKFKELKISNKRKKKFNNSKNKLKIFSSLIHMLKMARMSIEKMIWKLSFMNLKRK